MWHLSQNVMQFLFWGNIYGIHFHTMTTLLAFLLVSYFSVKNLFLMIAAGAIQLIGCMFIQFWRDKWVFPTMETPPWTSCFVKKLEKHERVRTANWLGLNHSIHEHQIICQHWLNPQFHHKPQKYCRNHYFKPILIRETSQMVLCYSLLDRCWPWYKSKSKYVVWLFF